MANDTNDKRERVRALVRDVLSGFAPENAEETETKPRHLIVNSIKDRFEREFDRDESAKSLLTEDDLRGLEEGSRVRISAGTKFTPLASDIVREKRLELIERVARTNSTKVRSVAIGADHGGFASKEMLKDHLTGMGLKIRDFGTNSADAVDYPDFTHLVAQAVGAGHVDVGIVIDGAGIGSAMAANKVPGVRAAACYSAALAANSREHNGANLLTLGSGQNSIEEMKDIIDAFLTAELSEDRHKRRVAKIDNIDRQYRR